MENLLGSELEFPARKEGLDWGGMGSPVPAKEKAEVASSQDIQCSSGKKALEFGLWVKRFHLHFLLGSLRQQLEGIPCRTPEPGPVLDFMWSLGQVKLWEKDPGPKGENRAKRLLREHLSFHIRDKNLSKHITFFSPLSGSVIVRQGLTGPRQEQRKPSHQLLCQEWVEILREAFEPKFSGRRPRRLPTR